MIDIIGLLRPFIFINKHINVTIVNCILIYELRRLKRDLKDFPDSLMDDMASKNISSCTVFYTALLMKTNLHIQPILS